MITNWPATSNPISVFGMPGSVFVLMLLPLVFVGFLNTVFFLIWTFSLLAFSVYLKRKSLGLSFVYRRAVSNIRFLKQPFLNNY